MGTHNHRWIQAKTPSVSKLIVYRTCNLVTWANSLIMSARGETLFSRQPTIWGEETNDDSGVSL